MLICCLRLLNMAVCRWDLRILIAFMLLQGICCQHFVEITPKYTTANVGERVTILCKAHKRIDSCRFRIQGESGLNLGPNKSSKDYTYVGNGFENGECGVQLSRVDNKHNGEVSCHVGFEDDVKEGIAKMELVVSRTPNKPVIQFSSGSRHFYKEGEPIQASCRVSNGRPKANVTWYLDETLIEGPETVIPEPDGLFTVIKNISHITSASDDGKKLKCVADHPGLPLANSREEKLIMVRYQPKDPKYLEHFGLVEGQDGHIAVEVHANPQPSFLWKVGDKVLREGDSLGRFTVLKSTNKNGSWESVLVIDSLTKEDVEQEYKFTASNEFGESSYTVVISTSPRPKVLEMGTGTIIIIIVVILLLVVFAVIVSYARSRGRWCFAGSSVPRLPGESSDTESTEHSNMHESPSKRVYASIFKIKNDKRTGDMEVLRNVPAVPSNMQEPQDESEGVVYAELDIQSHNRPGPTIVRGEDDKTEYAEIIHTKNK